MLPNERPTLPQRTALWLALAALFASFVGLIFYTAQPSTRQQASAPATVEAQRAEDTGTDLLPDTGTQQDPDVPEAAVGLYGLFDVKVSSSRSYNNPFDYHEIELTANYKSPSGKSYKFFGFYDGDGNGGLSGNIWRLRFMPDEVGAWSYSYSWSDGAPGGSGTFQVSDTGIPGPLRVAGDRSWFFETDRGQPFHWRGYSLHYYTEATAGRGIYSSSAWSGLQNAINARVADQGYNVVMINWPTVTKSGGGYNQDNAGQHFWQQNGAAVDFNRFYIPQWKKVEETISLAASRGVYVFEFMGMVDQYTAQPNDEQMKLLLRYMAARLGPYWNHFGYSPTWEFGDIWNTGQANTVMQRLADNMNGAIGALPVTPLLTIHDHSNSQFTNWLGFSMRQRGAMDIFQGNCRQCGQHGNVGDPFANKPIVGSEDIWELAFTSDTPKNGDQVLEGAWGEVLAGVMPVYAEDNVTFNGQGESHVRRMWDFVYTQTRYRQWSMMNHLVTADKGQIASGIAGMEYVAYDRDGGSLNINLSETSNTFQVTWFDPRTGSRQDGGTVQGGKRLDIKSPYGNDTVLLLQSIGGSQPEPPKNFTPTDWVFLPAVIKQ